MAGGNEGFNTSKPIFVKINLFQRIVDFINLKKIQIRYLLDNE